MSKKIVCDEYEKEIKGNVRYQVNYCPPKGGSLHLRM